MFERWALPDSDMTVATWARLSLRAYVRDINVRRIFLDILCRWIRPTMPSGAHGRAQLHNLRLSLASPLYWVLWERSRCDFMKGPLCAEPVRSVPLCPPSQIPCPPSLPPPPASCLPCSCKHSEEKAGRKQSKAECFIKKKSDTLQTPKSPSKTVPAPPSTGL